MRKQSKNMLAKRLAALMPNGIPKYVRVYDNGGETCDRYTVVFSGAAVAKACGGEYPYRAMSGAPYHPQGFAQWGAVSCRAVDTQGGKGRGYVWPPAIGRKCHLGKRIRFEDLPEDCQRVVKADYEEVWNLREGLYYGQPIGEEPT